MLLSALAACLLAYLYPARTEAAESELVYMDGGSLHYETYANEGETNTVNVLPDFSYAGYMGGGVALPERAAIPVKSTLYPSSGDNTGQIQDAIDYVSGLTPDANGFRGAVLLTAGTYELAGGLHIAANGVVVRGEGQGDDGTILLGTSAWPYDAIQVGEAPVPVRVEGEQRAAQSGTNLYAGGDNQYIGATSDGDWIEYADVNLEGAESVHIRVASSHSNGVMKIRTGSITGPVIGTYANKSTGGWTTFANAYVRIQPTSGTQDLYFTFENPAGGNILNIDWLETTEDSVAEVPGTRQSITASYVPAGTRDIEVASAGGYTAGDSVIVVRTPNQDWIDDIGMELYDWDPVSYEAKYERTITAINGNTITVDIPMVQAISSDYGGGYVARYTADRTEQVGIEDIRFDSAYAGETDEQHLQNAIAFDYTADSWVRNVTGIHMGHSLVDVKMANKRITIQDAASREMISIVTGGRRYPFLIDNGTSTQILFQRLYAADARHDFATGSRVPGPNVFLDAYATLSHADSGPHHRYATGTLYDNVQTGALRVWNRGSLGSGQGWTGGQIVFWNCRSYNPQDPANDDVRVASPVGAANFAIGCRGSEQVYDSTGHWESWGTSVAPRSLYLQQLEDRLGTTAVNNVTTEKQRLGSIWTQLAAWKGDGDPAAYADASANLAAGKTYTYSSAYNSYKADKMFDGDLATRWASKGAANGQWVTIDFGARLPYNKVVLQETSFQRVASFRLQSSDDGSTWTDIPGGSGTTIGSSKTLDCYPTTSRYLRLFIDTASSEPTINEMAVYDQENPEFPAGNLAADRAYRASTAYGSYPAANAFDEDSATRWAATAIANQWLSLDFGSIETFNYVIIKETSFQRVTSFHLQVSNDGSTWTDISGGSGTTIGSSKVIPLAPTSARYLRIWLDTSTAAPTINEIEVYNI